MNLILVISVCLLGLTVADREVLVTPKNIILAYFASSLLFGYLLFPISAFIIPPPVSSDVIMQNMTRSLYMNIGAFFFVCAGIVFCPVKTGAHKPAFARRVEELTARRVLITAFLQYIIAFAGILYCFHKTGIVPLFQDNPGLAKYFVEASDIFVRYRPIYTFSHMVLGISLTLSLSIAAGFFSPGRMQRLLSLLLAVAALFAISLTVKRGAMITPFVWVMTALLLGGRVGVPLFALASIGAIFAASAMWAIRGGRVVFEILLLGFANSIFIEMRELGNLLTYLDIYHASNLDVLVWGKTYIASLMSFVPSSISAFKANYYIGRLTLVLMGAASAEVSGGPRIGFVGEAYLNWWIPGVVFVSFIFGVVINRINNYFLRRRGEYSGLDSNALIISYLVLQSLSFHGAGSGVAQYILVTLMASAPLFISLPRPTGRRLKAAGEEGLQNA